MIKSGIDIYLGSHTEVHILASYMLGKFEMLWYQLAADIEVFHLNMVTGAYGYSQYGSGKMECWMVVLKMVWEIWRDLCKFLLKAKAAYVSTSPHTMLL